jgi:phage tail-like protein
VSANRPGPPAIALDHVVDRCRCYPGETVTFYTRVSVLAPLPGFALQVGLPPELRPQPAAPGAQAGGLQPELVVLADASYLLWNVEHHVAAGTTFEFQVAATAAQTPHDLVLVSEARMRPAGPLPAVPSFSETAEVVVRAMGRYMRFLPRIFQEQDELMGRFVMLFESFWGPIEQQVDHLADYFDPLLAPADLLPWLAAWIDLVLDERWPEAMRRRLMRSAVGLYRRRGTRRGLQEYLELYTGARVKLSEHGANNFVLGPQARLGPAVALGTLNRPHSFTVTVYLPAAEVAPAGAPPEALARALAVRQRMIETIIEAEKPAHASYSLRLETL